MRYKLKHTRKEIGICRRCEAYIWWVTVMVVRSLTMSGLKRTARRINANLTKKRVLLHRIINHRAAATCGIAPMPTRRRCGTGNSRVCRTQRLGDAYNPRAGAGKTRSPYRVETRRARGPLGAMASAGHLLAFPWDRD